MNALHRFSLSIPFVVVICSTMSLAAPQSKTTSKQAIRDGLVWLARHQNPDGSWGGKTLTKRCAPDKPCAVELPEFAFDSRHDEGLTGLAVLAFLRAGHGVDPAEEFIDPTTQQTYKVKEVVHRALEWLTKCQNAAGSFQNAGRWPFMYDDAIATLAMCEGAAAQKNETWMSSAKRGVAHIVKAQRPRPEPPGLWGWRYASREETELYIAKLPKDDEGRQELYNVDTSVTAWCSAALAAGVALGIEVKPVVLDGALAFAQYVTAYNGMVGYLTPEGAGATVTGPGDKYNYHPTVMSALAMLIRMDVSKDRKDPFFELAVLQLLKDLPVVSADKLSIDYYYWYHASLAINRFEGERGTAKGKKKAAGPWNKALTDAVLGLQDRRKDRCALGGWLTLDRWGHMGGVVYCTAMNVLTLLACDPK